MGFAFAHGGQRMKKATRGWLFKSGDELTGFMFFGFLV
jgi:hypothetical protein